MEMLELKSLIFFYFMLLPSIGFVKKEKAKVTNWVNEKYVICLEKKLPCECEKEIGTYFVMQLDTSHSMILLLKYEDSGEERYEIKKESKDSYLIIDPNKNVIVGKTIVMEAKLFIMGMGKEIIFNYYGVSESTNDIKYTRQNILLLNKAFKMRRYDSLQKILNDTSLNCHCSKHVYENKTIIWNDNGSKSWILELKNDSLKIYANKIVEGENDYNDSDFLKEIISYKWSNQ